MDEPVRKMMIQKKRIRVQTTELTFHFDEETRPCTIEISSSLTVAEDDRQGAGERTFGGGQESGEKHLPEIEQTPEKVSLAWQVPEKKTLERKRVSIRRLMTWD